MGTSSRHRTPWTARAAQMQERATKASRSNFRCADQAIKDTPPRRRATRAHALSRPQAFGEHLMEALDRPFGGLPELDAVEETAAHAKKVVAGLGTKLNERRKAAGFEAKKNARPIDVQKLNRQNQDLEAVAAALPTADGKELTEEEKKDAAMFMKGAAEMMDEIDRLTVRCGMRGWAMLFSLFFIETPKF